jgi:hypothetical protein
LKDAEHPGHVKSAASSANKVQASQNPEQEVLPNPQGIGMAVAFDWGLAVQIAVAPLIMQNLSSIGIVKSLKLSPPLVTTLFVLISLPFAALLAIFGEGIRRGWRWTRPVQIVANTLGFFGGIATLFNVVQGSKTGNYWPTVTAVILLIFSPLIAWRMNRPATAKWFANVTSAEARQRHGGLWPWLILIWSLVGGILQAIAAMK